jgi:hypothetical protein
MIRSRRLTSALRCAALLGLGCTGPATTIKGSPDSTGGTGGASGRGGGNDAGASDSAPTPPKGPDLPPLPDSTTVPGVAPLRRLTNLEYANTIRDLLGVAAPSPSSRSRFLADTNAGTSGFNQGYPVARAEDALAFLLSAEEIATTVAQKLSSLLPCAPVPATDTEQDACADKFITQFGRRAFRRPLLANEVDKLRALYKAQRSPEAGATFEQAIGDLVTAMVQAPELLYHWELGPNAPIKDGPLVRFNAYELASRLSYLFWASMPDDQLLAAAEAGQLSSPEQIVREARRLLAADRARDAVQDFHWQWLEADGLDEVAKDPTFTNYAPQVARSMIDESRAFAASVFLGPQANGKLQTLLTSPSSFVDAGLAKIYGVPAPAGAGLQPVTLSASERAGILTRAAFLATKADASDSNPIRRGETLMRRLFCMDLTDPVNVDIPMVPPPMPGVSTRERYEANGTLPCAAACHNAFVDQIGYAFENYDAIGAYRIVDGGKPVNAGGAFTLPSGAAFKFSNAIELTGLLAQSDDVRQCMTTQWLRYLLRRREIATEAPTVQALLGVFRSSGDDLRELMVALARTRTFTHRTLSPGEVSP